MAFYGENVRDFRCGFFEFIHKVDKNNIGAKYLVKHTGKECFVENSKCRGYGTQHEYNRMIIEYIGKCK